LLENGSLKAHFVATDETGNNRRSVRGGDLSPVQEVIQNHESANVRNIGQGEPRHKKYKRLKLGGGQVYDRSSN
jgi:hypothetical protein